MAAKLQTLKPQLQMLGASQAKQGGWSATRTSSPTSRGYGWNWRKKRDQVMRRDCWMCQTCARADRVRSADQVDHRTCKAEWLVERGSLDGCDDGGNLEAICDACHKVKTREEALRARARGGLALP